MENHRSSVQKKHQCTIPPQQMFAMIERLIFKKEQS